MLKRVAGKRRIAEGGVDSLDNRTVLALAGEILKGGPDAYRRRRYPYAQAECP